LSAFAVVFDQSNMLVDPDILERLMQRLNHRGPDGRDVYKASHAALGHWHFWTTPEEVGERQPLKLEDLPFRIVFDGRLDNRSELMAELGLLTIDGSRLSDAALILHSYDRWEEYCFEHFIGEFALVIWDERRGELLCARDALGRCTLFYAWQGERLVIASEAWAVAGACDSPPGLNEKAAAHFFAFRAIEDGQTLFNGIFELPPAHILHIRDSGQHLRRYWQPELSRKVRYKTDSEYAEHFLSLLEVSVRCRLRAPTPVGVLMSGGLDSAPIACLAARMITPQQLTTISYVFNEFPDCDERQYINAVENQYNTHSIQIPCDDLYPFRDFPAWPSNPNYPFSNFYMPIRERAHQRAQQEGLRVMLTGDYGDMLYGGAEDWLADFLIEGRFFDAGREVIFHLRQPDSSRKLKSIYFRRVARRILDALPYGRLLHRKSNAPDWLTPLASQFISQKSEVYEPISERIAGMLGSWIAQASPMDAFQTCKHELELRFPFRDRRLVEFMLAIPTYQIYHQGIYRYILRNAMQGILPEIIRTRNGKTSLLPLFSYGLEKKSNEMRTFFTDTHTTWEKYVDSNWLWSRWDSFFSIDRDEAEQVVPWLCTAFVVWYKCMITSIQNGREPAFERNIYE
jgi:asparagine synthase (glutamine-hydrolysing)